jgi:ribonucleoside-triphosphate reductase
VEFEVVEKMVVEQKIDSLDATDLSLFVKVSRGDIVTWDRKAVIYALLKETDIDPAKAQVIGQEVEEIITTSGIKFITAPLIRELVNAQLIKHGLERERVQHTRLGVPIFDVHEMLTAPNKENANVPHNPEATNLTLAESIKKQYALLKVFRPEIAEGHERGDFHLHDLGMIDRPYCSGNSLEYIKRFGLSLPNSLSISKPAKHAEVLLLHLIKFSAALQGSFAGAIGWDAVNLFMAPYFRGLSDERLEQIAQMLIFEFAQQAVARGGQSIFSDLNLYWEIPKHFEGVPAIGPGGEFTGNNYEDYLPESQRFATALFNVYKKGDGQGRPFFFPKAQLHITDRLQKTEGWEEFLNLAAEVSSEKGNTYYVFDRGDTAKISECCRLSFKLEDSDLKDAETPWKMRYSAIQNATLNMPRLAYQANGDDDELRDIMTERMMLMAEAHQRKKGFIQRLLDMKGQGPLSLLAMEQKGDDEPYYRMHKASFLFGMLGLNEMVEYHTGEQMHESRSAFRFGYDTMKYMSEEAERLGDEMGMKFVLEQTPAESTAYRMAKLDLAHFKDQATSVMKGSVDQNEMYYTNSTYLNVRERISPIQRVKQEGAFHPLIHAGSLTHLWLGEARPDPSSISNFVMKTFKSTSNDQICFSPEFTSCLDCGKTVRGLT